jgi:hypothetical protein
MGSEYTDGSHHRQPSSYYLIPKVLAAKKQLQRTLSAGDFDTALRAEETIECKKGVAREN